MTATTYKFRDSVNENAFFEKVYFRKVVAPIMRSDGYEPMDMRADFDARKDDIDYVGLIDGNVALTVEAKFDHLSALTGNMFLETTSVNKGSDEIKEGCFFASKAQQLHQVSILKNMIYISNLPAMRDYWYLNDDIPRLWHRDYEGFVKRGMPVRNGQYKSVGDAVSIELLFGDNHPHAANYLLNVYQFTDDALQLLVPPADALLTSKKPEWLEHRGQCPDEVLQWLP